MKIRQGGEKIKLGWMDGQDTPRVDLRFMGCICIFAREKNLLDRGSKPCRDDTGETARGPSPTTPYRNDNYNQRKK